eukprot:scaffold114266_cov55-Phaeocystis_antarctica.AAC.4
MRYASSPFCAKFRSIHLVALSPSMSAAGPSPLGCSALWWPEMKATVSTLRSASRTTSSEREISTA